MYYLRLTRSFIRASLLSEMAYRGNFLINLFYSLLNLVTGIVGLFVIFHQIQTIQGWNFSSSLALLGVYQIIGALRGLCFGPSLDSLAGMDGEIDSGRFDFTLLRPANIQFLASARNWRIFSLVDLVLGLGELTIAILQLRQAFTLPGLLAFLLALIASLTILYAVLLIFSSLVFWSPGFLFTWLFDGLFQMARYPVGLYPGWLRLILTWIVPVGIMTTFPAQAISGTLSPVVLAFSLVVAIVLFIVASLLFKSGLRRYASASS